MRNYVGEALIGLKGDVRDIASADARRRNDTAQFGLQGAKFQHDIARQQKFEDPLLQRRVDIVDKGNRPVTDQDFLSRYEHRNKMLGDEGLSAIAGAMGATRDKSGQYLRGGKPVQAWELEDPAVQKNINRVRWSYIDPVEDADFGIADIQDRMDSGQPVTPKEKAFFDRVSSMKPEHRIAAYDADLARMTRSLQNAIREEAPTNVIQALEIGIQRQKGMSDGLRAQLAEQSKRDFELEKIDRQGANQIEAARIRSAGRGGGAKPPSAAQIALETETALRHGVGTAQSEGIPVEWDDKAKRPIGTLSKPQFDRFNQIMKQVGHMTYAVPGEVTTGGEDWIPFNEKQEQVYDLTDLVPASVPFQTGGIDEGGGAPASSPEGLPQGAKQAQDGNYYVEQGGKFFRVDPVQDAPQAGAQPTQPAPASQPVQQPPAQAPQAAPVPTEVDMMKGPTPEQRAAANQEMNALLSKLGIGKSNWQAAGRLVRDMGGGAWEEYSRLYNLLASPIAEAYSKEGRQEGIDRLRGKRD